MSYKPSENIPMAVQGLEIEGTGIAIVPPVILSEHTGRWFFLQALQLEDPAFWSELRDLQRGRDETGIVRWMTRVGVIDPWFIEVIWDTVKLWIDNPAGRRTQLTPGYCWFSYRPVEDGQIPKFRPKLTVDEPDNSTGRIESPDAFAVRARSEFESQLQEYVRYLRSLMGEDHISLREHAQWTALAFKGLSYGRIAAQFKHLTVREDRDADMTVKMAVHRFSKRIELTLPRSRRRVR